MTLDPFKDGERPPRSGFGPDKLDPSSVWSGTDVLLAQADFLERLARSRDLARKLMWAMAVAADCIEANPTSSLALINAARVARAAKKYDLATRLLASAKKLGFGKSEHDAFLFEESRLIVTVMSRQVRWRQWQRG